MFNWFWKLLGYHVCEEFTQWKVKLARFSRPATYEEVINGQCAGVQISRVSYSNRWQERQCTICGKLYQRELEH